MLIQWLRGQQTKSSPLELNHTVWFACGLHKVHGNGRFITAVRSNEKSITGNNWYVIGKIKINKVVFRRLRRNSRPHLWHTLARRVLLLKCCERLSAEAEWSGVKFSRRSTIHFQCALNTLSLSLSLSLSIPLSLSLLFSLSLSRLSQLSLKDHAC